MQTSKVMRLRIAAVLLCIAGLVTAVMLVVANKTPYMQVFAEQSELTEEDERIIAATAGMSLGTELTMESGFGEVVMTNSYNTETSREGLHIFLQAQNASTCIIAVPGQAPWDISGYAAKNVLFAGRSTLPFLLSADRKWWVYSRPVTVVQKAVVIRYTMAPTVPFPQEEPTQEGYHFVAWHIGQGDGQCYDGDGCCRRCDSSEPIFEDTDLHAYFEINTYTVQYDTAGGTSAAPVTVDWNTVAPLPTSEREGYDLTGWQLPDGTAYSGQKIKQDTVLTATWEIRRFVVTFYVDGQVYKTVTVEYGKTLWDTGGNEL